MNYRDFNDYELLDYIASCDEEAQEILLYKYRPLIVNLAQKAYTEVAGGVDINDLIQEGMLGLNEAIVKFNEQKDTNFGTFAKLCVQRRMISFIKSTKTYKNRILNESVTLESDEEKNMEKLLMDYSMDPSNLIEEFETQQELLLELDQQLSDTERQVFELKKNGFTYREIADMLEKEPKVIDNTIQRIKQKLKKIIAEKKA